MRKKGQEDVIMFLAIAVMILAVVIATVMMTKGFVSSYRNTKPIEALTIIETITHSPYGIMYVSNDKVDFHVVDSLKFNEGQLNNALLIKKDLDEYPGAKLVLINSETGERKDAYWNKEWFDRGIEKVGFFGGKGAYSLTKSFVVSELVGDFRIPSKLIITVVVP